MWPQNYVPYHMHSMLSNGVTNIDSITDFHLYVDEASKLGMKAFAFSEHGCLFSWLKKKEYIESKGMKYIHAVEAYLTDDSKERCSVYSADDIYYTTCIQNEDKKAKPIRIKFKEHWFNEQTGWWNAKSLDDEKIHLIDPDTIKFEYYSKHRDNYHIILIARNYDGVKELNKLISIASNRDESDYHFYYMPRITFEELFNTSDNILVTTACLGGVLHNGTPEAKEKMLAFLRQNKNRCWLEIQHHNCKEQIEYNKLLYNLSKEINIPLIAGTDTHALNDEHMLGRYIEQKAKGVHFDNEDAWDLTFKSFPQLVKAYKKQNSLPIDVVYQAIEQTNVMADMVEEFKIDYSPKYPKLYKNSEKVFQEKINEGVIKRKVYEYPNYKEYLDRIHYEYDTYKHNGAIDFMLLEEDYKTEMRKRGIRFGYGRGSVSGSLIAYLLGVTEVDSVKFHLNFERFMNRERVSLADVDTDWYSEDRDTVRDYLYQREGLYCCDIVTFNTIALKGSVNDICRGMFNDNLDHMPEEERDKIKEIDKQNIKRKKKKMQPLPYPPELKKSFKKHSIHKEVSIEYLKDSNQINELAEVDEEKARKKYPEVFHYVDLVRGCVVSVGNHPSACVVSPYPVDEWFGTFMSKEDKRPISVLNMKEIDSLNFVKLDILGLDNIGLIYKTCDSAGIPFLTPDNTPIDDVNVWKSIREDTTMIFQWESSSATDYLKQLFSDATIEKIKEKDPNFSYLNLFAVGNGALRPAGESYRDQLAQGVYKDNGDKELNEFLNPTLGFLTYQEEIIGFLHNFCGFTMGEADVVRRHFSKKTGTENDIPIIRDGGVIEGTNGGPLTGNHIDGFIKVMHDKYGVKEDDSKKIIEDFLQVIIDASDYLFSENHSIPYSFIGYVCGYLRYYYPLEFITNALNIFSDKEEKSTAIINYAKKQGIKISPIRFRHSLSEYSFDRGKNQIFKGIASIKYLNVEIANEMYALRNNYYKSFVDLLYDLKDKTTINARQIKVLIELDFFEEFGNANYLLDIFDIYDMYKNRKQLSKKEVSDLGLTADDMKPIVCEESDKKYTKVNMKKFINILSEHNKQGVKRRTLKEMTDSQLDYLGYVDVVDDRYKNIIKIMDINTKYTPRITAYALKTGKTFSCKISKRIFNKNKLHKKDIIRIEGFNTRPKSKKVYSEDGLEKDKSGRFDWIKIPGTSEIWLTKYNIENFI